MSWTYSALKTALAALPQPVTDLGAAASTLNAQTVPAGFRDMPLGAVQGILLLSGDWMKIKARAKMTPSNPPVAADQAIGVAQTAIDLVASKADVVSADHYQDFAGFVSVLVASGDISSASQTAIAALGQPSATAPKWQPPVTPGDIQTASAQS